MRRWMSKLFALLLTLVMLLGVMPTLAFGAETDNNGKDDAEPIHVYTEEENALLDNGVFADIQVVKSSAAARKGAGNLTEADYVALVPKVVAAIMKSDTYVPGTLQKNGNFLVWDTTVGIPCCYSPRMEARLAENAIPGADPEALAETVVTSYADRGGWPGSLNVAVFQPYYGIDSSFTTQYKLEGESIAQAVGGTNTTYIASNATIDNIANAIESCGVVIFDSHGCTDYEGYNDYTSKANTSYLCLTTSTGITSEDTANQTGPFGTYKHCMKGSGYAYVDGTCMSNHMDGQSPNGHVWMAICLGMATDGLEAPLRDRGVEVVYGYSQSVSFTGDYKYEEYFWNKMKSGSQVKEAAAYMKQMVGDKDPYTNPPAYPIFVSDEDVYPGHGNVDKVQPVYSTWTLFPQYEVTAVCNNDAWGTVEVDYTTITATPAEGYFILGSEVISGTATVTQEDNVFMVDAQTDCTVQINFAPRNPATVQLSVPDGVTCDPIAAYVGDTVTLPAPQGTPSNGDYVFTFLGWTTEPVIDPVSVIPAYSKAGTELWLTTENTTLYALYGYYVGTSGGQFKKVTAAPDTWEGEYLITYEGTKLLNASGNYHGSTICASKAVTDINDTDGYISGDYLNMISDELIFTVSSVGNGAYAVKMKNANYYLSVSSDSNILSTAEDTSTDNAKWTLSVENGGALLTNVKFPQRTLQFNAKSSCFRAYKAGAQSPVTLYSAQDGSVMFTTEPNDQHTCAEHDYGEWIVETEPTCTEPGSRYHVCSVCGRTEYEEIPALGHDYEDGVCIHCGAEDPVPELTASNVASTGKVKLTWTAVDGAESYNVYRAFSKNGTYSLLKNTTDLSFIHTGAKAGKTYYYKVAAVYTDRVGSMSAAKSRTCDLPRPVVTASHVASTGKNKLTWNAVDGAVQYEIYCAEAKDGAYDLLQATTELSYVHTDGVAGKTYYYKVVAVAEIASGNSAYSVVRSLVCDLACPEVSIALSGGGNPKLTWNAVDGAVEYTVYRATSAGGTFSVCYTTKNLSFINTSVEVGKTYYYKVVAIAENAKANSAYSAVVSIKAGR